MNKKIRDAVRKWPGKAASGISGAVRRMRLWQKIGLILCLLSWILSFVIAGCCRRLTAGMTDQNFASRWTPGGGSAQISTFIADNARLSEESVLSLYAYFNRSFQEASIFLSETQIENGAKLLDACYCGFGNADLSVEQDTLSVTAIGVGGDFFNFHPLDLMDGYYFAEDDLMKDRILLDDETAWRLFGSPFITGQIVNVGGKAHVVAGVFRRPEGRFYKSSGMGNYLIFVSYDSLCRYTSAGAYDQGNPSENEGEGTMEAMLLPRQEKAAGQEIPAAAAWAPSGQALTEPDAASESAVWQAGEKNQSSLVRGAAFSLSSLEEGEEEDSSEDSEKTDSGSSDDPKEDDDSESADGGLERGIKGKEGGSDGQEDDSDRKQEVDRNRISCYEAVLPNPLSGYALRMVRSALSESGINMEQVTVVDNSSRFDVLRLILMLAEPGVRSMQTAPIRYPYWENVALAWEDVLIPYALLWAILRYGPVLFLLFLAIWYATHKSWTAGGVIRKIQDRIYDRQSEKIYGKRHAELPHIEKTTEEKTTEDTETEDTETEDTETEDTETEDTESKDTETEDTETEDTETEDTETEDTETEDTETEERK